MAEEVSSRWDEGWFFIREDGTSVDPEVSPEALVVMHGQIGQANEIERQEREKERKARRRRRRS